MEDAKKHSETLSEEEKAISSLTTLERNEWAKLRKQYLCSGVNDEARDLVERAVFCLWLVDETPDDLTERGKLTLHGNGQTIWFDKCFNVIVYANGRCGLNCEHTLCDAPAYAHMWEWSKSRELFICNLFCFIEYSTSYQL